MNQLARRAVNDVDRHFISCEKGARVGHADLPAPGVAATVSSDSRAEVALDERFRPIENELGALLGEDGDQVADEEVAVLGREKDARLLAIEERCRAAKRTDHEVQ